MIVSDSITVWDQIIKSKRSKPLVVSINKWIESIKNPGPDLISIITEARSYGKGTDQYDSLKKSLPIAQLHGVFPKRNNNSVESISGFAYIDIDEGDPNTIINELKSNPYVYAIWKSVSGQGLGVLVKYIWQDNIDFNSLLEELAIELQVTLDVNAKGLSRPNFLSYDPDLYHNPKAIAYEPIAGKCRPAVCLKGESINRESTLSESSLKFEVTLDHYPQDVVFIEKIFFKAIWWIPGKGNYKSKGERTRAICMLIRNLVILNPNSQDKISSLVFNLNEKYCVPPLPKQEIYKQLGWAFAQQELNPVGVTIKKIWVNPTIPYKLKAIGEAHKARSISAIEFVLSYLLCGGTKITPTLISRESGLGRKTIYKYLPMFADAINEFNKTIKKS